MLIVRSKLVLRLFAIGTFAGLAATAAAQPVSLTTAFVKVDTGMTLQYVVQGDPKGPVIVLLHGAGDSWHSWELVLPHIPKTYRTYAVTLRGHGLSDHPAKGYSRAEFASDVTALLKMLNLRDVTLVGHSLGSFVAQVVAQNDVEGRLSRLVLVGSGPGARARPERADQLLLRERQGPDQLRVRAGLPGLHRLRPAASGVPRDDDRGGPARSGRDVP